MCCMMLWIYFIGKYLFTLKCTILFYFILCKTLLFCRIISAMVPIYNTIVHASCALISKLLTRYG
jgi:hypothetical protein